MTFQEAYEVPMKSEWNSLPTTHWIGYLFVFYYSISKVRHLDIKLQFKPATLTVKSLCIRYVWSGMLLLL